MSLIIPCISLWQPWASLIALGAKQTETRSWQTPYRGLIAIHAAKRFTNEERALLSTEPFRSCLLPMLTQPLVRPELAEWAIERALPFGKIVAVCRLVDCRATGGAKNEFGGGPKYADWVHSLSAQERAFGDYTPGRYGWALEDIRRLDAPILCRGQQGMWKVELPELPELEGLGI